MLTLIIAETALETIPKEVWNHPTIKAHSKKQRKIAKHIILDRSFHHKAMNRLQNSLKRGRPDIVHFALLEALSSPLNQEDNLRVYVHTNQDYVISVNPKVRLPRNFSRFVGLIEQLFQKRKVPLNGKSLLSLEQNNLPEILNGLDTDYTLIYSTKGIPKTVQASVSMLASKKNPVVIIGGFAHGDFSENTIDLADEVVCVDSKMLDVWTLTSRVVYEYEKCLSIPENRLNLLEV